MRVMTYHHKSGTQSSEVHKDNNGDWLVKHHSNGKTKEMNANDADHAHKLAKKLVEDAPVNSAGNGGVAGIGVGPQGEPGGKKAKLIKKILKRRSVL